jgi:flagellar assembly protein FliH
VADVVPAAERRAIELALTLAEKIVTQAIEADPELVSSVVSGALRRVIHHGPLVLEVNPADVDLVKASLDDIERTLGGLPHLDVVGERRIARGGCVVRTAEGEIDARIETQLDRAANVLS